VHVASTAVKENKAEFVEVYKMMIIINLWLFTVTTCCVALDCMLLTVTLTVTTRCDACRQYAANGDHTL